MPTTSTILREAVGIGHDVREIGGDRPDADDAAGRGDGARMVGRDLPRPRRRPVAQRGVRQHQRLGRDRRPPSSPARRCRAPRRPRCPCWLQRRITSAPNGRQPAMDAGFGLDVAQLVRPVVRELQMAQRPALVGLVEALDPAFEEVARLPTTTMSDGRLGPRRAQAPPAVLMIGSSCSRASACSAEGALAEVVELAGPADRGSAAGGRRSSVMIGEFGHDGEADRRHAALAHRLGDRRELAAAEAHRG